MTSQNAELMRAMAGRDRDGADTAAGDAGDRRRGRRRSSKGK